MRIRMKSFLLMFCLFAAIAANAKKSLFNFSLGRMGISPEETAKHRRLLMTMLTDSTAGKTQKMWIFPFIIILF